MIAYVSFVAIANIFLGMLLARVIASREEADRRPTINLRQERNGPPEKSAQSTAVQESPGSATGMGDEVVVEPPQPKSSNGEAEPEETTETLAAPIKSWDEFARQLRDVRDRAHYCRTAQSTRLAQQAAEQLRACAKEWYGQFDKCLRGERLDDATQALVEGKSMSAVEMFASQITTTLSNIDALDFTTSVDDVLIALERELEMLDRQHKSVSQSTSDT